MSIKHRQMSIANMYHITVRGVAKQIIFEDDDDRMFFGARMRQYLEELHVPLLAWCFMSNHVHLVVRADMETIRKFMHRLLVCYARHFNDRHGRVGHLFQNRFDSVPIQTESQLMATVRYVHRNPEEAGECSHRLYRWSSYREYVRGGFISDTAFVLSLFDDLDGFIGFHDSPGCSPRAIDKGGIRTLDDLEAAQIACELLRLDSVTSIASLGKEERDRKIVALKQAGFSIPQIARLAGVGRNIVQRA